MDYMSHLHCGPLATCTSCSYKHTYNSYRTIVTSKVTTTSYKVKKDYTILLIQLDGNLASDELAIT